MICFDTPAAKPYHYALMSSGLPEFLDLSRVTRQPLEQAGRVRIGTLSRLSKVLNDNSGEALVRLQAKDDGSGRIVIHGEVQADIGLLCQRCLKPMRQHLDTSFALVWVRDEREAAAVQSDAYDPLLSRDGRVKVADLIEDELLLALPIVALHESDECETDHVDRASQSKEPDVPVKENPFAVLEKLKQRR